MSEPIDLEAIRKRLWAFFESFPPEPITLPIPYYDADPELAVEQVAADAMTLFGEVERLSNLVHSEYCSREKSFCGGCQ